MISIILFLSALFSQPLGESKLLPPNNIHRLSAINNEETLRVKKNDLILIQISVTEELYIFEGYCEHTENGLMCDSYKILHRYNLKDRKVWVIKNSRHLRKIRVDNHGVTWNVLIEQSEPQRFLFNK